MTRYAVLLLVVLLVVPFASAEDYHPQYSTYVNTTTLAYGNSGYDIETVSTHRQQFMGVSDGNAQGADPGTTVSKGAPVYHDYSVVTQDFLVNHATGQLVSPKAYHSVAWDIDPVTQATIRTWDSAEEVGYENAWNGYPESVKAALRAAGTDTDHDGIPDEWDISPLPITPGVPPPPMSGQRPSAAGDAPYVGGYKIRNTAGTWRYQLAGGVYGYAWSTYLVRPDGSAYEIYYEYRREDNGQVWSRGWDPTVNQTDRSGLLAAGALDADRNGIPDWVDPGWGYQDPGPGTPPIDPNPPTTQAATDTDGDGFPDTVEQQAGTNPADMASTPVNDVPGGSGWSPGGGGGSGIGSNVPGSPTTQPGVGGAPTTQPGGGGPGKGDGSATVSQDVNRALDSLYKKLQQLGLSMDQFRVSGTAPITVSFSLLGMGGGSHEITIATPGQLDVWRSAIRNILLVGLVAYFILLHVKMLRQY